MIEIINRILKVLAENNLFNEGVELIGSWCFQLYQRHLGAKKFPLRTQDIDFLIPCPYRGDNHLGFISQLEELGFKSDFKSDGSLYLWNAELEIEFITPEKGRGTDNSIRIKQLGLNAIPLRFVNFLLVNPISLVEDGIKVLVPNPVNFCLHSRPLDVLKSISKPLNEPYSRISRIRLCNTRYSPSVIYGIG